MARLPFRLVSGGVIDERILWGDGLDRGQSGDEDLGDVTESDDDGENEEEGRRIC